MQISHKKERRSHWRKGVFLMTIPLVFVFLLSCNKKIAPDSTSAKTGNEKSSLTVESEPDNKNSDEVLTVAEEPALPMGGYSNFNLFIKDNLQYPATAREKKLEGRVFIQFVVDLEGSLTAVEVIKGIGEGCDEEAVRLIKSAEKWKPARNKGVIVKQRILWPVDFKL